MKMIKVKPGGNYKGLTRWVNEVRRRNFTQGTVDRGSKNISLDINFCKIIFKIVLMISIANTIYIIIKYILIYI